jgi:hypothetical protein
VFSCSLRTLSFARMGGNIDTYGAAAGDGTLALFNRGGSGEGGCCESEGGED